MVVRRRFMRRRKAALRLGHVNRGRAVVAGQASSLPIIKCYSPSAPMGLLSLRAAITRGVLLVVANWPIVLIDFAVESLYKLAVSVPVLGASLGIAALVGEDLTLLLSQGVRATADVVLGSLATAPVALTAFLLALAIVAVGGEAVMFVIKAGTLAV